MLNMARAVTRRQVAICYERLADPVISAKALAKKYGIKEAQVYTDLKTGEKAGAFSKESRELLIALQIERSSRVQMYKEQLLAIQTARRKMKRDLNKFLRDHPDPPPLVLDAVRYHETVNLMQTNSVSYMALDQQRFESMIFKLEESMIGIVDLAGKVGEDNFDDDIIEVEWMMNDRIEHKSN